LLSIASDSSVSVLSSTDSSISTSSISGSGSFNLTLSGNDVGTAKITITLTDNGGTAHGEKSRWVK